MSRVDDSAETRIHQIGDTSYADAGQNLAEVLFPRCSPVRSYPIECREAHLMRQVPVSGRKPVRRVGAGDPGSELPSIQPT